MEFIHKISKGSRFNQIYIPREMDSLFEVGDLVEVKLLKKSVGLFVIGEVKLSEFKENLIREVFSFLGKFKEVKQVFFFGSFLTKKVDYNDIDLLIVAENKRFDVVIYKEIIERFNLKFHVISIPEEKFFELSKICPLTRNMLGQSVSNKKFNIPEKRIDKKHIEFLLMMPEDLMKIKVNSRVFYDSIRRLIVIGKFLEGKEKSRENIEKEMAENLGKMFEKIRDNEEISEKEISEIRKIIKKKLNKIRKKI
ncbi:MAG: nucleotidyltransferase domain-containing protein [Nanoarchaeota archaeon]